MALVDLELLNVSLLFDFFKHFLLRIGNCILDAFQGFLLNSSFFLKVRGLNIAGLYGES